MRVQSLATEARLSRWRGGGFKPLPALVEIPGPDVRMPLTTCRLANGWAAPARKPRDSRDGATTRRCTLTTGPSLYNLECWCSLAWFARQQFNGKQDSEKVLRGRVTGSAAAYELNLRCPRNGKQTSGLEFFLVRSAFISQPLGHPTAWEGYGGRSASPDTGQQGGGSSGDRQAALTLKHRRGRRWEYLFGFSRPWPQVMCMRTPQ